MIFFSPSSLPPLIFFLKPYIKSSVLKKSDALLAAMDGMESGRRRAADKDVLEMVIVINRTCKTTFFFCFTFFVLLQSGCDMMADFSLWRRLFHPIFICIFKKKKVSDYDIIQMSRPGRNHTSQVGVAIVALRSLRWTCCSAKVCLRLTGIIKRLFITAATVRWAIFARLSRQKIIQNLRWRIVLGVGATADGCRATNECTSTVPVAPSSFLYAPVNEAAAGVSCTYSTYNSYPFTLWCYTLFLFLANRMGKVLNSRDFLFGLFFFFHPISG